MTTMTSIIMLLLIVIAYLLIRISVQLQLITLLEIMNDSKSNLIDKLSEALGFDTRIKSKK